MTKQRRAAALALLACAVAVLHLWLGARIADAVRLQAEAAARPGLQRLRADFVVELKPQAAPAPVTAVQRPRPPPPKRALQAAAPTPPASAPRARDEAAGTPAAPVLATAPAAQVLADAAGTLPQAPQAPASAAAEADQPPPVAALAGAAVAMPASSPTSSPVLATDGPEATAAFDWPRSTRLSYRLTGHYRGPVDGTARVEWLLQGTRYQVHVEVAVGPSFAPLVARRMSSDGEIGPDGLAPRYYEEETRVALRSPRRAAVQLDDRLVRLANGQQLPRPPGVQDTASQFVHLTWLFRTQPQRLRPGETVELMLALPRRVDLWTYDVQPAETVYTDAGPIEALPVRPRRLARPQGELTAEFWVAPSLQYLPVRFVIRQDDENHVDLLLDRLPQQAVDTPR